MAAKLASKMIKTSSYVFELCEVLSYDLLNYETEWEESDFWW